MSTEDLNSWMTSLFSTSKHVIFRLTIHNTITLYTYTRTRIHNIICPINIPTKKKNIPYISLTNTINAEVTVSVGCLFTTKRLKEKRLLSA